MANKRMKPFEADPNEISYVEFYAGIGGWTMALEEALGQTGNLRLRRLAALDHSDLCTRAFEHNFGSDKKSFAIERLSLQQVEDWSATVWAMSPPCQPHTRQHDNQSEDMNDPRSSSFLHICSLLEKMDEKSLPSLLFLENVIGFETSNSCQRWRQVLANRKYHIGHFHLTPTQVGLPNDRPRYFCMAIREDAMDRDQAEPPLQSHVNFETKVDSTEAVILKYFGELDVILEDEKSECTNLSRISAFLDKQGESDIATLRIPEKVLSSNASWCFDLVTPNHQRSACFTQSYGRFIKGTGSVLYEDSDAKLQLVAPSEREFEKDWAKDLDLSKLRYFSGKEIARMMGFRDSFSFPPSHTVKQQWKLLGNSLNVRVASRLVQLGFRLLRTPKHP
jgi:tRNA (cytosine38-C5)-methyltransferase